MRVARNINKTVLLRFHFIFWRNSELPRSFATRWLDYTYNMDRYWGKLTKAGLIVSCHVLLVLAYTFQIDWNKLSSTACHTERKWHLLYWKHKLNWLPSLYFNKWFCWLWIINTVEQVIFILMLFHLYRIWSVYLSILINNKIIHVLCTPNKKSIERLNN